MQRMQSPTHVAPKTNHPFHANHRQMTFHTNHRQIRTQPICNYPAPIHPYYQSKYHMHMTTGLPACLPVPICRQIKCC